ncbi:flagellar biosynthesis protein FlhB [uncultured Pseudoflavonifractor sp.]|uniref:flagellar biosynthesis protein FlhB n=1 Tax=uncultured Pseudoflavonifractor sp. TaxID=1221379 RepID=UPI0025E1AE47|nr:flagellar biosynthesis protein FlhB [uncultured Pseudoflavonifractor sp.]
MADSEKTEKATPKKRRDERKKGNIFFSNDAVSVVVLLAGLATLFLTIGGSAEKIQGFMRQCIEITQSEAGTADFRNLFAQLLWVLVQTAGPLLGVTVAAGIAATFSQTKMLISGEALRPKFSHINPLQGVKRLFSLRSIIEALKGLLKIAVLLYLIYQFLSGVVDTFSKYLFTDLGAVCSHLLDLAFQMSMQIAVAYVVLAAADIFYQWWDYERQIRMSKREIKEEYKQMEGDPQVKGRIKELQRKMAQSRMMQKVPQADVVIRNPTHFAVALRYKADQDRAPVVLAKGQDQMALRIVSLAEENGVAVVENVPLARALYASTDLEQEIPPELYGAVAEVLVYLYQMNEKGS